MRIPRIYTHNRLDKGQAIELETKAHKHLKDVLRMSVGDSVILFNGDGCDYQGKITELSKKKLLVTIEQSHALNNESCLNVHLLQPLCSSEKMDLCLQKATELGVKSITPFISNRVNIHIAGNRLEKKMAHWQSVIQSACEQSGRAQLPMLHSPAPLYNVMTNTPEVDVKLIASPTIEQQYSFQSENFSSCVCAIGPEGGFTDQEVHKARELGFKTIQMGPRVLRLETAVISALTLCQYRWGDF